MPRVAESPGVIRRLLPEQFGIVGVARTEQTTKQWAAAMKKAVREHARDDFEPAVWRTIEDGLRYVATDFADLARALG